MASIKTALGTSNQAFTVTLTSLGNAAARESTAIDNSGNLYLAVRIAVKVKANASGTVATGVVNVYVYETADGGTTYTSPATGSNAAVTPTVPTNFRFIGAINVVANAVTYVGHFLYDNPAEKWGIVVENLSGATLDASVGSAWHQGIFQSVA